MWTSPPWQVCCAETGQERRLNTVPLVFISFLVLSQRSSLMLHAPTSQTSSSLVHVQFSCFYTIWLNSFCTTQNRPLCLLCTVKNFCAFRLDCVKFLRVIMLACKRPTVSHPPSTKAMQVWMRHPKSVQHMDRECVHWVVLFAVKGCLAYCYLSNMCGMYAVLAINLFKKLSCW